MSSTSIKTDRAQPPITRRFAEFVSDLKFRAIPPPVIEHLKTLLLDNLGVTIYGAKYTESSDPFFTAIKALNGSCGRSTVVSKGSSFQPQYAMMLNGAYSHTLDFDDTHIEGVVHPGASVIAAALTEGESTKASGQQLLTAIAAGYEVVCRLGVAIGSSGFAKGFHNTSTCGIFGAIAAISSLRGLDADIIEMAFGVGISKTAGSMQFLTNGAWNKRLHPGFAAHDAYLSVAFAQAGVMGAMNAIEGEHGLLCVFGNVTNFDTLLLGLGKHWACNDTAIKPYPACRLTHGAIDLASSLRLSAGPRIAKSLRLSISPLAYKIVGLRVPNKLHPQNNVDAQFSIYYQTAVTWLDGSASGWKMYDRLLDTDVSELMEQISVVADEALGDLQARIEVVYKDGTEESGFCEAPLGEVSNPLSWEHIKKKYSSLAIPVVGENDARRVESLVASLNDHRVAELMCLL